MASLSSIHKKKNVGVTLPEQVKPAPKRKTVVKESASTMRQKHHMPYFDENDEKHAEHMEMLDDIASDDPALYKKMQNWE